MYIKNLILQDIRCFENAEIHFSKSITILTGANNSGKSTILKSIYKLQESNAITLTDIRSTQNTGGILIEVSDINETDRMVFNNGEKQRAPKKANTLFVQFKLTSDSYDNKIIADEEMTDDLSLHTINHVSKLDYFSSDFTGLPRSEDRNNFIYPYFAKRKTNNYYSSGGKDNTFSVLDTFQNLPSKVQKVISQTFTKREFDEMCMDILGFEIGVIPGDNNELRLGIYTSSRNTVPLESMGDGVVNILGIIVTLLTEDQKLFLIEELENDIHPLALKKILNLIIAKSEKNQFIISSHSNIVLKYLGSLAKSKIIYTESEIKSGDNSYLPVSRIEEIPNSTNDRLRILEMLGYDLFDFDIYSGYLVLEESSAERVIRDFLIPVFYPNLKFKLRTIAAQGVNDVPPKFNDLYRLFLYLHTSEIYHKRAWVIVDGDTPGKEAVEKLKQKFASWNSSHFMNWTFDNFERYYPERFQNSVEEILSLPNGQSKQERKSNLLNEVMNWTKSEPEEAASAFEISAKEVIEKIKQINDSL